MNVATLLSPLPVAVIVAVVGVTIVPWALRQPTRTRIAIGLAYLSVYTYALSHTGVLPFQPALPTLDTETHILVQGLQILWWFVFARCLIAIGRVFLLYRHKLQERKFATDLLSGAVYLAVVFAVVGFVFELPITGLLATSGAVAIVLGLALQSTVSDVFSGIALSIERPYRIGDLIGLEGSVEGTVIEISWRATHIMSGSQDDIIVPNSVIAKSRIVNYSFPLRVHGVTFSVLLDDRTAPGRGIEILEHALLECRTISRVPRPQVTATHFGRGSIGYSVSFFVDRVEAGARAKSDLLALIHRHAAWAGVRLGRGRPDAQAGSSSTGPATEHAPAANILDRIALFARLSTAEREALKPNISRRDVRDGELVFEQGHPDDSLFLIDDGVVSLARVGAAGAAQEFGRLGPGDVFGMNGVLPGARRSASVRALTRSTLYEIPWQCIAPLLDGHPELKHRLSAALAQRSAAGEASPGSVAHSDAPRTSIPIFEQIAHLIRSDIGV